MCDLVHCFAPFGPDTTEPQLTGWARVLQVIFSSYPYWILLLIVILAIAGTVLICKYKCD